METIATSNHLATWQVVLSSSQVLSALKLPEKCRKSQIIKAVDKLFNKKGDFDNITTAMWRMLFMSFGGLVKRLWIWLHKSTNRILMLDQGGLKTSIGTIPKDSMITHPRGVNLALKDFRWGMFLLLGNFRCQAFVLSWPLHAWYKELATSTSSKMTFSVTRRLGKSMLDTAKSKTLMLDTSEVSNMDVRHFRSV